MQRVNFAITTGVSSNDALEVYAKDRIVPNKIKLHHLNQIMAFAVFPWQDIKT